MFNHTCINNIGICDCGESFFYCPKSRAEIKDNMQDWIRIGNNCIKLKYSTHNVDWLIENQCIFNHDLSNDK